MSLRLPPNPKFGEDFRKTLDVTIRAALSIRCATHNQTARTEHGQIIACCDDLERQVLSALEKIAVPRNA